MDITPYKAFQGIFTPFTRTDTFYVACCVNGVKNSRKIAPLVTITKLQVSPSQQGLEPKPPKNDYNAVFARVERFALQDVACEILPFQSKKPNGKQIKHRVNLCLKRRITKEKGVTVFYNEKREKAQYGNLQTCGSVWDCPICSMRISEGRREELKKAFANWRGQGGAVYLATFTNRHHCGDVLDDLVEGQKKALKDFWQKSKVKSMLKDLGYKGRITATECTNSEANGWHPHYHMLFFFSSAINYDSLKYFLATEWQKSCVRVGLKEPSISRGVDIQDGSKADKYIAKWGLEHEMTKWHSKKGREDSYTPFDFLRMAEAEPDNKKWRKLFREYSDCFHGRKQLSWSRGLKDLLGVEIATDEELAEQTEKESIQVKELPLTIWTLIKNAKKRAEYLHAIELDYLDGKSRADDLVMGLAKNHIAKLLANVDDFDTS